MPIIKRQQASGGNGAETVRPGSVLSRAKSVGDLTEQWLRFLIYGQNGVGKTTLAATFPKPILFLSWEPADSGGAISIRKEKGIKLLERDDVPDVQTMEMLIPELNAGAVCDLSDPAYRGKRYQTIVVDSVTTMQTMVLQGLLGRPVPGQLLFGTVSTDQYRQRSELTVELLNKLFRLKYNLVFIGKEKDHNPPKEERVNPNTGKASPDMRPRFIRGMQQESFISVDLGGGAAGWLQDACNYVGRLYMDREVRATVTEFQGQKITTYEETGKFVRALRVAYHPNFMSRFRSDTPKQLPEAIIEPTWEKIKAAIEGKLPNG